MPSDKVAMAWGLIIIMVLLFPLFNSEVHTVAEDVNATMLEAGLLGYLPLTYIIVIIGSIAFTFVYTVDEFT